jgi:DNA (cytosine-5)-methyltransferase 1
MSAWYNEIDPKAAAWLRELISRGLIAPGDVDERDIRDVSPDDLKPYTQCHFFAGIGTWSYALRCAGWPDGRPVWTGSPPCQPFSAAGRRGGVADERHLWPHYNHLIGIRRPGEVLIEQVASKDGLAWLDLVQADLEGAGYAYWASDLCAAGFGAPHIRQRQYGAGRALERMGDSLRERLEGHRRNGYGAAGRTIEGRSVASAGADGGLADSDSRQQRGRADLSQRDDCRGEDARWAQDCSDIEQFCSIGGLADDRSLRCDTRVTGDTGDTGGEEGTRGEHRPLDDRRGASCRPGPVNGFWSDADWLGCRDGKWRPVKPGLEPLAHGTPARVGRLRGYGNGIVAAQAQAFIEAYLDAEDAGFDLALGDRSVEELLF